MSYEVGSVLPFEFSVYNSSGALANASATVVTVTAPDGTTTTPSVTNASTGVYTVDVTATMAGVWSATIATTSPTDVSPAQSFYVSALASTISIVSIDEVKEQLRWTRSDSDEKLRRTVLAANAAVEDYTDRSWRRKSVTETYDGGRSEIVLRSSPVRSITSVTEGDTALSATDYFVRSGAPILVRGSSTSPSVWQSGLENISVTYVVGPQEIPEAVRRAVMETARAMWQSQRGGVTGPEIDTLEYGVQGEIPAEVKALLMPHCRAGVA